MLYDEVVSGIATSNSEIKALVSHDVQDKVSIGRQNLHVLEIAPKRRWIWIQEYAIATVEKLRIFLQKISKPGKRDNFSL